MGVICNGGFSGTLVLGFVYGLGLDMERSWGSEFCRRCVCVYVRCFFVFFRRLVVRRKTARAFPMSNVHDTRSGGWVRVS